MSALTGRCLCGAVTWRTDAQVLWAGHCHCESCRRATASPMTSFFGVPRDSVAWTGKMGRIATSKGQVTRHFCAVCGTQMTYQNVRWPDETHLYAATMDDPSRFHPEAHFHYDERLPWMVVDDDLVKHPGSAEG